ncbi:hypothetical protein [Asticcacaulis sp. AC402]|uniref:hypothetical protein n=1 Tax=Asticcacaulis sp. AC402 TaxID=1282361 RepID=UPI0003C3F740|nr:hypothetical protein [Asticcacaulis sp. AC402]ESQ77263.1 hypothetical protein ABAC402_02335 [Asticcacaulis sp. AC402]
MRAHLAFAVWGLCALVTACNAPPATSQDDGKIDGKTATQWEAEADDALVEADIAPPLQDQQAPKPVTTEPGKIWVGPYRCSTFVDHLQNAPGFTVNGDGSYTHDQGSTGTISRDATGLVLFSGGALDGRAAKYEVDLGGRPTLRLYDGSRSQTVIDCQK